MTTQKDLELLKSVVVEALSEHADCVAGRCLAFSDSHTEDHEWWRMNRDLMRELIQAHKEKNEFRRAIIEKSLAGVVWLIISVVLVSLVPSLAKYLQR